MTGHDMEHRSSDTSEVSIKVERKIPLTYVIGGQWSDLLIGMFGAIEFAATTQGDTPFTYDQTWVRGILSADIAARHDRAFVLLDQLDTRL